MKHYLIIFALLFAGQAWGQVPDVIPPNYEKRYKRLERRTDREIRKESPDVILDPIESLPITPTFYALETGNWGPGYLGINNRIDDINARKRRKVAVFIFDTGGCYDHPYLKDVAWNDLGRSFTGEDCKDGHGHSTHVAGIIAAHNPDYPLGAARMLRDGFIKVIPIKVLSNGGSGSFTWITNGTKYANQEAKKLINEGWFVVYNYSLGGGSSYSPLENAFKEAEALGVLINCAANGNTGKSPVNYPGSSPYTLGTAALAQSGSGVDRAGYSSYGPETWGAAPGSSILSTWPGGGTAILSGTSMATPHQCGVFAILASVYPNATAAELKEHYVKWATDLGSPGKDEYFGYGSGVIDALLDNNIGEPEPNPPTCTDGKQNGKETGVDCGGPDCPACEEPEPGKPPYRATARVITFEGRFPLGWFPYGSGKAGATSKDVIVTDWDMTTVAMVAPAARKDIIVTKIGFLVQSETVYEWEYDALQQNIEKYFKARAIGTPASWDGYDSGKYISYFLDWHAKKVHDGFVGQELKGVTLEFEMDGRKYSIAPEDIPDYQ